MPHSEAQRAVWRHRQRERRRIYGQKHRVGWVPQCPVCGHGGRGWYIWASLVRVEHGRRRDGTMGECYPGRVA